MNNRKPRSCRRPTFQIESLENRGLLSMLAHPQTIPAQVQTLPQNAEELTGRFNNSGTSEVEILSVDPVTGTTKFKAPITVENGSSSQLGHFTVVGIQYGTIDRNGNLKEESGDATLTADGVQGHLGQEVYSLHYELKQAKPNGYGFDEVFGFTMTEETVGPNEGEMWKGTIHATDTALTPTETGAIVTFDGKFEASPLG